MDHKRRTQGKAAPAEYRQDRQMAVLLECVLDLELAVARQRLEASRAAPPLVEKALQLLRDGRVPESFLATPFEPDRHGPLLEPETHRSRRS
jgi:hypothetical protein